MLQQNVSGRRSRVKEKRLTLGERLAAARLADPLELEQAKLRLVIVPLIGIYLLVAFLWDRRLSDAELVTLWLVAAYFVVDSLHFAWALWRPGISHPRRCIGVVLDVSALTFMMARTDEIGAVLYGFYPWIVIGNGFRFGLRYLLYAQALAIAGFGFVLWQTPFWEKHVILDIGLLLVLLAVPLYVAVLVARLQAASARLHEARGQAEAANVAKTKFLAAASHDLRQPMQALSMYASVLKERLTDPDALRVVHGVQLAVRTLEQLFDSLLDISRIESGVVKPNVVEFPVMPLIHHLVDTESPLAAQKGLELRAVRCSASVRSDPVLLERMLKNLLTNAIRYTERGRIIVGCRRGAGGRMRLQVVDSGIGIPSEEQQRIFDEYYQLEGSSTQGLGLGLPIVKSLGELLGHRVSVQSVVGRGSTFSIELHEAGRAVSAPPATPAAAPPIHGVVALVDDDVDIRASMGMLIESWGCRCIAAGTFRELQALLRAQDLVPDAAIIDYRLADTMTGLEVIMLLRAEYGEELPALLVTGTPNAAALREQADVPVAVKPLPAGKLRAFLSQALR